MSLTIPEILRRDRDVIIADWEQAVADAAAAERPPISLAALALRNDLPEILSALTDWLEGSE